ncbi:MAG: TRAP transporter substrate-binding protein [Planctomycetaceae bacterium]|nr:TRAP transporter substrate-binding protein [Planctomycetaceae bacterium]
MNKLVRVALAVILGVSLACSHIRAGEDAFADLESVELVMGDGAANGAAGDLWAIEFCKKVEELTGGKLTIAYFGNSQLGVDSELQQQMLAGDIAMMVCQPAQTTPFVKEVAVFDLPMVFAKYDAQTIDKALNDSSFTKLINEGYARANMLCLGFLQGGTFREMTSNKEIRTIDDFAGVKIRTMDAKFHLMFWQALGANPTPLAFTELYMSLQQGVVQAQENANDTNVNSQFFEVQKYLVNTHHILYLNQFLVNKATFESLDPAYQNAIRQAVAEATAVLAPQMGKINDDNKQITIDKGMISIEFAPEFIDEAIAKADNVYTGIRAEIGDEIVDALINELKAASENK